MNNVLEISSISLGIEHVCSPSLEAAALCSLIIFKGPSSILIPPPPKLSSADLALLIYTPLNLGEVAEASLKGAPEEEQRFTPVWAGCGLLFRFTSAVPRSPRSVNQSAGCQRETGWRLAGDALLSCSFDPPSLTWRGFSAGRGRAVRLCRLTPFPSFNMRSC